jgi:uncharacterized membrane protein
MQLDDYDKIWRSTGLNINLGVFLIVFQPAELILD